MPEKFEGQSQEEMEFQQKVGEIKEKLGQKYSAENLPEDEVFLKIINLKQAFGDLEDLKGRRILDLGCGSNPNENTQKLVQKLKSGNFEVAEQLIQKGEYDSYIGSDSRSFEPWLCRILVELGAQPVGIDIGNLEGEEFEHYKLDLSKQGVLDFLPDESFDGINMSLLLSSPQLESRIPKKQIGEMKKELEAQVKRLLKKDGKIIRVDYGNF